MRKIPLLEIDKEMTDSKGEVILEVYNEKGDKKPARLKFSYRVLIENSLRGSRIESVDDVLNRDAILQKLKSADDDFMLLEDEEWRNLKSVMDKAIPNLPFIHDELAPFIRALKDAPPHKLETSKTGPKKSV